VLADKTGLAIDRLREIAPPEALESLKEYRRDERMWLLVLDEAGAKATVTLRLIIPTPKLRDALRRRGPLPESTISLFDPSDDRQLTFTVEP